MLIRTGKSVMDNVVSVPLYSLPLPLTARKCEKRRSPRMRTGTVMLTKLYPKYHESRKEMYEVEAEVEVDPNPEMVE